MVSQQGEVDDAEDAGLVCAQDAILDDATESTLSQVRQVPRELEADVHGPTSCEPGAAQVRHAGVWTPFPSGAVPSSAPCAVANLKLRVIGPSPLAFISSVPGHLDFGTYSSSQGCRVNGISQYIKEPTSTAVWPTMDLGPSDKPDIYTVGPGTSWSQVEPGPLGQPTSTATASPGTRHVQKKLRVGREWALMSEVAANRVAPVAMPDSRRRETGRRRHPPARRVITPSGWGR